MKHDTKISYRLKFVILLFMTIPVSSDGKKLVSKNEIALYVYNLSEHSQSAPLTTDQVELELDSIKISPTQAVEFILTARHIFPNDDAYLLLYELNPNLKDVKELPAGGLLRLPSIKLNRKIESNEIIKISLNGHLKYQLVLSVDSLNRYAAGKISPEFDAWLKSNNRTDEFKNCASYFNVISSSVQQGSQVIVLEQLQDLMGKSELLLNYAKKPDIIDTARLRLILSSLNEYATSFSDIKSPGDLPANPNVSVLVNILFNTAAKNQPLYRVYYIGTGLYPIGRPSSLSQIKPVPISDHVPQGTWVFWAVKIGQNPYPPDSETVEVKLRLTEQNKKIDIAIVK